MKVTLKLAAWRTENGVEVHAERYEDELNAELLKCLNSNDSEFDVQLINDVPEQNFLYEDFKEFNLALKCFLMDLKDDGSSLCKHFNIIDKVDFAKHFLNVFLTEMWSNRYNDDNYAQFDAMYGRGLSFICYISKECTHGRPYLDIYDMSPSELLRGVIAWYYKDLSMWDRASLRNNKEEMEKLRKGYIRSFSFGPH